MIRFDQTQKTYRALFGRSVPAVRDLSLDVAPGEILGIAGPNGAGKSTMISLLLGFQYPTGGHVTIAGMAPRAYVERYGVAYVPELVAINPSWRAKDALTRFAVLTGIPATDVKARVESVIEQVGLHEHRDKKIKALSKGNAQRVAIAQALLGDEQVMIFDEPTHGLDPVWTLRFRDIVMGLRRPDRTIIIASHNLDELQRLADRVAIIDHGRLQRVVSTGFNPTFDGVVTYRLSVVAGLEALREVMTDARMVDAATVEVTAASLRDLNQQMGAAIARGVMFASVAPARSVLEQQFHSAVGE